MERSAECPRCGYDVSASIASWHESCPIEGQCPECGLAFHWGDLLHPERRVPRWFFEHAIERIWRRSLGTLVRTANPAHFFKHVRIHHRVQTRRLLFLIFAFLASTQLLLGAAAGGLAYAMAEVYSRLPRYPPAELSDFLTSAVLPQVDRRWVGEWQVRSIDAPVFLLLAWSLPLLLFFVLGDTMRLAKVRWVHLWRVACYGLIPFLLLIQAGVLLVWLGEYADTASHRRFASFGLPQIEIAPLQIMWLIGLVVSVPWLAVWWFCAIKYYMRLPKPWLVFLVMHGTAMFATGVLFLAFKVWIQKDL